MKIVLDTNVLIAALLSNSGSNRKVVRRCLTGQLIPQIGTALFLEYEDVFARDYVLKNCLLDKMERDQFFDGFMSVCHWKSLYYSWRPNLKDEGDNHLIELAIASGARAIVTNNIRDFRNMDLKFEQLEIMTPAMVLEKLR